MAFNKVKKKKYYYSMVWFFFSCDVHKICADMYFYFLVRSQMIEIFSWIAQFCISAVTTSNGERVVHEVAFHEKKKIGLVSDTLFGHLREILIPGIEMESVSSDGCQICYFVYSRMISIWPDSLMRFEFSWAWMGLRYYDICIHFAEK